MKIVFDTTGDELDFKETSIELVEYYVHQLSELNHFKPSSNKNSIIKLKDCLSTIDNFFVSKLKDNTFSDYEDLHKQSVLNKLHHAWVTRQLGNHSLTKLLEQVHLLEDFRNINSLIHDVENEWNVVYRNFNKHVWQCNNIFGNKILDFSKYNISIVFNTLGRSSYNKWFYHDDNATDKDTDNFSLLGGEIRITLNRPYTLSPPVEYIRWCQDKQVEVVGDQLGLGNFTTDIDTQREIFQRNESNSIILKI